jgi:flagellin-specific chaperone FliS
MLIAQEKYRNNIAEYILYMFRVEDTIRACKFDMGLIEERVISQFSVSEKVRQDIRDWYADLILAMHQEKIRKTGHLAKLNNLLDDLNQLHIKLIHEIKDPQYLEQYSRVLPNIKEFITKLDRQPKSEIEACLIALYALLLLKLTGKTISHETLGAMQTFSNLLAILSERYKKCIDADQ